MQAGSKEAFTTLYLYYSPRLYINILRIVKDPLQAEEMVQELFSRVWLKKENKGIAENFAGYIYAIGQNLVHDFFRKLKKDQKMMERFKMLVKEDYEPIEEALQYRETTALLKKAVDQLSPQQKRVYELIKLNGYSYKKAAEIMGISPLTIKEYLVASNKSIRHYILTHTDPALVLFLFFFMGTIFL
jgi:RNA polymerase sigma-70 factor (ECF subfamily)